MICLCKRLLSPALHYIYENTHTLVHTVTDSFPSLAMQTIQRSYNGSVLREDFWKMQYMAEKKYCRFLKIDPAV